MCFQAPTCAVHEGGDRGLVHAWILVPQEMGTGMALGQIWMWRSQLSANRELVSSLVSLKNFCRQTPQIISLKKLQVV